jgi:hypothetical protein
MALFGAPIAREGHAQRACYAALHLRDEIARYVAEVKREHAIGFSVSRRPIHQCWKFKPRPTLDRVPHRSW